MLFRGLERYDGEKFRHAASQNRPLLSALFVFLDESDLD
jgi:hypothetical protein